VERHVALVAGARAEIRHRVLGPLVGLGQEHPVTVPLVDVAAELPQELVGRLEVLAARPVLLVEVRDGVEPQPVETEIEPVVDDREHLLPNAGVLVVEIGLVGEEAVPVVGARHRIPGPVRGLRVGEDDPRIAVAVGAVAPDVVLAPGTPGRRPARPLEPGVLVGGVVEDELPDDAEPPAVGLGEERADVGQGPVVGVDAGVVGRVVAVVAARRGEEGQQPEGRHPEVDEIVELLRQAREVADPVAVAVAEGPDRHLVDDGVLVPVRRCRWSFTGTGTGARHAPSLARRHAGGQRAGCYTPGLTATTERSSVGRGRSERGMVRAARQTPARRSLASRAGGAR
jgi:hypothetical protein